MLEILSRHGLICLVSATQTVQLVDKLVKAKRPKATATKLIDYVEKRKDKSIERLWIALLGGFVAVNIKEIHAHA